jgi:dTDP-4-amino-4,6-dideoxygalactose transaminase
MTRQRASFLPFALPHVTEAEIEAVAEALRSGWVTTGPRVQQFEQRFADAVGCRHAIAVGSCTAAMHLALEALGIGPGDEVITTPYTFTATAAVICHLGAQPVFADIDPQTLNLSPEEARRKITARTKGILVVHVAGYPADLNAFRILANEFGLKLVEDAAHAFPVLYQGQPIGTLSDATCFSFYATKTITTGEGGMLCTNDDELAERARIMRLHGMSRDAWKRYTASGSWYYEVVAPGFKYNMTDPQAAMGLVQLGRAEAMRARREAIARAYTEAFADLPEVQPPIGPNGDGTTHSWHLYTLRLNLDRLRIDRAGFIEELRKRQIGTSVHFIPLHIQPFYRQTFGYDPEDFPVAYREYLREISLPIYSKMTDDDAQDVIDAVRSVVQQYRCSTTVSLLPRTASRAASEVP